MGTVACAVSLLPSRPKTDGNSGGSGLSQLAANPVPSHGRTSPSSMVAAPPG